MVGKRRKRKYSGVSPNILKRGGDLRIGQGKRGISIPFPPIIPPFSYPFSSPFGEVGRGF